MASVRETENEETTQKESEEVQKSERKVEIESESAKSFRQEESDVSVSKCLEKSNLETKEKKSPEPEVPKEELKLFQEDDALALKIKEPKVEPITTDPRELETLCSPKSESHGPLPTVMETEDKLNGGDSDSDRERPSAPSTPRRTE